MGPDLITQILLRLPVKSVIRFKAVCKFWRSLISDPHFARSHFELASPRLLFTSSSNAHAIRTMDFEGSWLRSDLISEPINCDFLSNYDFLPTRFHVNGFCRGFLLITCNESLYLWNPSTHVHKPIPSSSPVGTSVSNHLYGFGYDPSKDDYLVVLVPLRSESPVHFPDVQFFSLRANMWKYTEGIHLPSLSTSTHLPPLTSIGKCSGLLFDEAIHWNARNWVAGTMMEFIIAFDLIEKRLLEIPRPDDLVARGFLFFNLWVHGRFLSLSVMQRDRTLEIWVMKKYRVQTSWTKTLVLSSVQHYPRPICSTKGGDIVMSLSTKLIKYSDEGEQLEHYNHCCSPVASVPMYTESMFSLPEP